MMANTRTNLLILFFALLFLLEFAVAAEDFKSQLPRIKPVEPADVLKTFEVLPGVRIELVAAEPLVVDPIAMAFDENSRLFVVEMRGYSEDADKNLGRIRLLEDTDGDGRFDKSTIYIDGLSWPTAVTCWDGGVFIAAAPDIWWAKDTDGDGKADIRKRVFTGFGRGNVQGLVNTFKWNFDNRIEGVTSSAGGSINRVYDPKTRAIGLRGRDFSFDPRTMKFNASSGGAQHGMSYDDFGRKFVCSNSDHLQVVMFEDHYAARNPYQPAPRSRASIAADGGQAKVYRISDVEPWRIVRTRLRVAKKVPGPVEGGGTAAGYFTGSTGVTIYRGDALPEVFGGMAIIGDVGSNIVHRKVIEPVGVGFVGKRVDKKSEFIASRDIWFRPVQFANGPDGALYIADMYREVIEHPKSLPPMIKKHLDLTSGRDRGRLYRVVGQDFVQSKLPRLGELSSKQLVKTLAHRNGWHRDTASRLLYQRQDAVAIGPLRKLAAASSLPEARIGALYALDGMGALGASEILNALADKHPRVREHAVRLVDRLPDRVDSATGVSIKPNQRIQDRLAGLVHDKDIRVRYQIAFTLGNVRFTPSHLRAKLLARLLGHDGKDPWMRFAVLSSISQIPGDVLAQLSTDANYRQSDAGQQVMIAIAQQVGRQNQKQQVEVVEQAMASLSNGKRATEQDRKAAKLTMAALSRGVAKSKTVAKAGNGSKSVSPAKSEAARRKQLAARMKVVESYRPALKLEGNPKRGKVLFAKSCAICHQLPGQIKGNAVGPNLAAMANRGADAILLNLLAPNREVNPQYQTYAVFTTDGQTYVGMIVAETATSVNLIAGDGKAVALLRIDIDRIQPTGLSLMPVGLEKSLDHQGMADLLAYLMGFGAAGR
jgi:putative membrane-bound dehydrogenase-like protein